MQPFSIVLLSLLSTIASVQAFAPSTLTENPATTSTTLLHSSTAASSDDAAQYPLWTRFSTGVATTVAEQVRAKVTTPQPTTVVEKDRGNLYVRFAQRYPFLNNVLIATLKTGAADLLAQTALGGGTLHVDVPRSALFMLFGALYSGGFQWWYQVNIFKKLFSNVDQFTQKPWKRKLRDRRGLQSLAAQTALDLGILSIAYLPAFYVFKASVFSGSLDPTVWFRTGLRQYQTNLAQDWVDMVRVWLPADLLCFSVPMYLRLPVRHAVSFAWTVYLSLLRGGH